MPNEVSNEVQIDVKFPSNCDATLMYLSNVED